jgi:hypothetical protein
MTARFHWIQSYTAAGGEVYTPAGYRAEWIPDYLDFRAAQEVPPRRIPHIARVCIDARNWIEAERPDGPHGLRHTGEGYLPSLPAPPLPPTRWGACFDASQFSMRGLDSTTGTIPGSGRIMPFRRRRRHAAVG